MAIIIPVVEVWGRGNPVIWQMNKTEQSVRGRINATNIADLNPNKNALNANTKKSANPILEVNSSNLFSTYKDSSYIDETNIYSGRPFLKSSTTALALETY